MFVPTVTDTIDGDLIGQAGPDLKLIASSEPASITSTSRRPESAESW